ncbi:MAG TPA: hypothetical protein VEZ88_01910 [Steroidobacteraceae bacterium]|nr:hypothetical protein [Steroidobacteraceae bacterium]
MRRTLAWLAVVGLLLGPATAFSQTITRYARFVGNINFVATGGSRVLVRLREIGAHDGLVRMSFYASAICQSIFLERA